MSPLIEVRKAYTQYLYFRKNDQWAIDFALALMLSAKAHRSSECLFGSLVGPPASGKTEILRPYFTAPGLTVSATEFTANAFMSGSPTVYKSLLNELDRRAMVLQDMTSLMSQGGEAWERLMGVIRTAFDGNYNKKSGAKTEQQNVIARFSIMGAVTEQIYTYINTDVDAGQRFLYARIFRKMTGRERRIIYDRATDNSQNDGWRQEIFENVHRQLKRICEQGSVPEKDLDVKRQNGEDQNSYRLRLESRTEEKGAGWAGKQPPKVTFSDAFKEHLWCLTNTVTHVRSAKIRPEQGMEEAEGPARFAKQLSLLVRSRCWADNRTTVNEDDMEFARIIARDTVSPIRMEVIRWLFEARRLVEDKELPVKGFKLTDIISRSHLDGDIITCLLNHWCHQGYIEVTNTASQNVYMLASEPFQEMTACGILEENQTPKS